MEKTSLICESCKIRMVEITNQFDEGQQPYRLCLQCNERLIIYALRPLEYFNLAAIHGHDYYLQDDFYENENGLAIQPKIKVVESKKFPFPKLQDIKTDLIKLIDFACVQYFTSEEVIELLKGFGKPAVLSYLQSKVDYNRAIHYKVYEIAARVLGPFAADWIRMQWKGRKNEEILIFAQALVSCLPFDEAFDIITGEIESSEDRMLADHSSALLYLENEKTLEWIEKIAIRIKNVSTSWGTLAAASQFDWQTAQRWLDLGRPLSLIALDALDYCTSTGNRANQAQWLIQNPPKLHKAPEIHIIANALEAYLKTDNVPRTKIVTAQIINNLFDLH